MDVRMWDTAASCIENAKASGYRVVATHFDPEAVSIHDVDWTQPTAILLGNEREGMQPVTQNPPPTPACPFPAPRSVAAVMFGCCRQKRYRARLQ